ncbi:MAG: extracellular solute-binding protein [Treponema sp.]|jgi:putative aldouronate transport system substrate-binding protein|nr:extracellular solute-binding protein [Treponema sp.]
MKRKILLVLLVAFLTASLFAAGGQQEGAQSGSGTGGEAPKEDITLRFLISSGFYDLDSDTGWAVAQRVSGYKIDYEVLNSTEQLMLIVSSGEPYDYINLTAANYSRMLSEGALSDITDLLKEYGGNITRAITTLWPSVTVDGRIYAIPSTVAQPESLEASILYRKDLWEKAGIPVPATADEFYESLKKFKATYPDIIPLTTAGAMKWGGYFIPNISSSFGIRGIWQEIDGKIVPIIKNPNLKPYIAYMAKLYSEGLLDKEMPALKNADAQAKWTSQKAAAFYTDWNSCNTMIAALRQIEPSMKYDIMPLFKDQQGNINAQARSGVGAYAGFPVTSKYPKEAMIAVNNQIELKNFTEIALGIEGKHYEIKNGAYYPIQPIFNDEKINSNVFVGGFYREDVYPRMWEGRLRKDADLEYCFNAMKASLQGKGIHDPIALAPPVTVIDNMSALNTYVRENLNAIVAGAKPLSFIDEISQYWSANGGDKAVEFYNQWKSKK